jgi:hypothetical protein
VAIRLANATANAAANGIGALCNTGILRIYSGTIPTDANTAIGAQTILAELTMNATAFPTGTNGVITANAITQDTSANATGTASFYRLFASNGTTVILDGTVGTSGADLNLNSVSIQAGAAVQISSYTLTVPLS